MEELVEVIAAYVDRDINLDIDEFFVSWRNIPSTTNESFCFLAEIQQVDGSGPFRIVVKDLKGEVVVVAFHLGSYDGFDVIELKRGRTLAVFNASQHQFHDGTNGIRVENIDDVYVIPCTLESMRQVGPDLTKSVLSALKILRELAPVVAKYAVDSQSGQAKCHGCEASKPIDQMSLCGQCKVYAYCNKECQAKGWTEKDHKSTCKLLRGRSRLLRHLGV